MKQLNEYELSTVTGGNIQYYSFCCYCGKPTIFAHVDECKYYKPGTVVRCTECGKMMPKAFADANYEYYQSRMAE